MPQLDIHTFASQIFWLLVSFTLLCAVVSGYLAPTIGRRIQHREDTLTSLDTEVQQLQKSIRALTEEHALKQQHARTEALRILTHAEQELRETQAKHLQETFEVLIHQARQTMQRMDQNKTDVLQEAASMIAHVTSDLLRKLTGLIIQDTEIKNLILKEEAS